MGSYGSRTAFPNALPPRPLYPRQLPICCTASGVGAQIKGVHSGPARRKTAPCCIISFLEESDRKQENPPCANTR
jgi:hypothetical protein